MTTQQGQPTQTQTLAKVRPKRAGFRGGRQEDPLGLVGENKEGPSISQQPGGLPNIELRDTVTPDCGCVVPSSPSAGYPQHPKPWISFNPGRKNQLGGGGSNPRANSSPSASEFQEPPWWDYWSLPDSLLPALPPLGKWGEGGLQGCRSRQGLSQSLPSQIVGGADFLPGSGTWSLGCQFPRSWHSQKLRAPNTLSFQRAAPGSSPQPHKLPTPSAPSSSVALSQLLLSPSFLLSC